MQLKSKYNKVFDFGCSFTCYRWLSWSDIISINVNADCIYKQSSSGSGVKHLYYNFQSVCKNNDITEDDLVLIQIPNFCRHDKILNRTWTNMGDFELEWIGFSETYFPEDLYGPDYKFNLLDHFAETMHYLEQIKLLIEKLKCDVIVIQTDLFNCDLEQRLYADSRQKILDFSKDSDPEWTQYNHNLFIDSMARIIGDFKDTQEYFKQCPSYRSYIFGWAEGTELELERQNWMHDPHPSIPCILDFLRDELSIDITPECMEKLEPHITEWRTIITEFLTNDELSNQHIHETYKRLPFERYNEFMQSDYYLYHIWPF